MATNRKRTNPPNDPSEPSSANAPPDRYFEVKAIVWILRILIILFILNNHLSLGSKSKYSRAPGSSGLAKKLPSPAAKNLPKNRQTGQTKNENQEFRYFVLNLEWGPDFVKSAANGSCEKLQNHIRAFDHSFTIHQFRVKTNYWQTEPTRCDQEERLASWAAFRVAEVEIPDIYQYWPSFLRDFTDKSFWWHEW